MTASFGVAVIITCHRQARLSPSQTQQKVTRMTHGVFDAERKPGVTFHVLGAERYANNIHCLCHKHRLGSKKSQE